MLILLVGNGYILTYLPLISSCVAASARMAWPRGSQPKQAYRYHCMKQNRLNHLTVLHVHKDKVDTLDVDEIAKAFIAKCYSRHATFGRL